MKLEEAVVVSVAVEVQNLHHLLLDAARRFLTLHGAAVLVLGIVETQWTTTVRVALELLDSRLSIALVTELDHTCTTRAAVGLVLDLCALDAADRLEELDKVLVAGTPWQLYMISEWPCALVGSNLRS